MGKTKRTHRQRGGQSYGLDEGDDHYMKTMRQINQYSPGFSSAVLVILSIVVSIVLSTTDNTIAVVVLLGVFAMFLFIFIVSSVSSLSNIKVHDKIRPYTSMFYMVAVGLAAVFFEIIIIAVKYQHYTPALIIGIVLTSVSVLIMTGLIYTYNPLLMDSILDKEGPSTMLPTTSFILVLSAAGSLAFAFLPQTYISTSSGGGGKNTYA
jgi:hypothetical protein